jgi:hypothetical protein
MPYRNAPAGGMGMIILITCALTLVALAACVVLR